eukprot:CAMPEP_0203760686 /NCGR_PEP_ID=MMETSP0098-20131031/13930_1 /ASSEMBLY_ACC=CAM_ASM_000208 /TAXON_ID=96639 /ORGANISM=" , Strain NY0313808BC1" /LENGTH=401 /DNA_ID=CAMNT_0050654363 /DNA_START=118 /DNA_END=1319 /DNA_ORIENTATION=-
MDVACFFVGCGAVLARSRARARGSKFPEHLDSVRDIELDGPGAPKRIKYSIVNDKSRAMLERGLLVVVRSLCDGWEDAHMDNTQITTLQGGLTNQLYLVDDGKHEPVLVRIYGQNTEILIDRKKDTDVFHMLSDRKFGPELFGLFENGRVEQYIHSQVLTPPEMGEDKFVPLISRELARMHSLDLPLNREPYLFKFLEQFDKLSGEVELEVGSSEQRRLESLNRGALRKRLKRLETELPSYLNNHGGDFIKTARSESEKMALEFLFESVYAHNDLLAGNILYVEKENRVQFIDFEYGKYNYRGFDIANHFCEYAGFDFNLEKWYPTKANQIKFVEFYINASDAWSKKLATCKDQKVFFDTCIQWLDKFIIASHYLWGLWAIIQKKYSPIDFDYLEYAGLRL